MKHLSPQKLAALFALGRPFSPVYNMIMSLRQEAYRKGIFKASRVSRPVISIGNLCLGGTGKTPHVMAVSKWLKSQGLRPAIVTRGYGGKAGKGPVIVSDGGGCQTDPETAGDEPCMLADTLPGVPVIAGSDRVKGAETAISRFDSQVVILDDGFQHLRLQRELDIVLLPASSPLGTGRIFPGGDLRESPASLKRASCIILSKCELVPFSQLELVRNQVISVAPGIPVFSSWNRFKAIRLPESGKALDMPFISPVYCFCGIANPYSFISLLEQQDIKIKARDFFPDHCSIDIKTLSGIFRRAAGQKAGLVLTTAKDFARIRPVWERFFKGRNDMPRLGIVEIDVEIEPSFWRFLNARLLEKGK